MNGTHCIIGIDVIEVYEYITYTEEGIFVFNNLKSYYFEC